MSSNRRLARALVIALMWIGALAGDRLAAQPQPQQPPPAAQDEFVPIDQLPENDRLPAARFLIAAYAVAWLVVAAYLWSIWQRLARVERELAEVRRRTESNGAAARATRRPEGAG